MSSISKSYNYLFIPILQPVVGAGSMFNAFDKYNLDTNKNSENIKEYSFIYASIYSTLKNSDGFPKLGVYDFTNLFQNYKEYPFYDECHIREEYQYLISDSIYSIIKQNINVEYFKVAK